MDKPRRLLIQNADWIITMDEAGSRIHGGDLYIVGNKIVAVGKNLSFAEDSVDEVVDARGFIIIPGMINTHHHCAHTIVRNLPHAFESNLMQTLRLIYDRLACFTERSVAAAALGAMGDLLKTGCTTSCDQHYAFPAGNARMVDMVILAAKKLGIRFHAMRGSLSTGAESGDAPMCPLPL